MLGTQKQKATLWHLQRRRREMKRPLNMNSYTLRSHVGFRTRCLGKAAEPVGQTLLRSGGSERGGRRDSELARTSLVVERDSTTAE